MRNSAFLSRKTLFKNQALLVCLSMCISWQYLSAGEKFSGIRIIGLKKLTNSVLSGTVPVSFEARNEVGMLRYAMLQVDGHIFPGDDAMLSTPVLSAPLKSRSRFHMDTCYLENGTHTLQIHAGWSNFSRTNLDDREFRRESALATITVSNEVYYPESEPEVGERVSAYFFKTTHTNVGWHLDIYDVKKKFVQRLSGNTGDGRIEAYWDLRDAKGVLRTNADVDPEFSSVITVNDSSRRRKIIRK